MSGCVSQRGKGGQEPLPCGRTESMWLFQMLIGWRVGCRGAQGARGSWDRVARAESNGTGVERTTGEREENAGDIHRQCAHKVAITGLGAMLRRKAA